MSAEQEIYASLTAFNFASRVCREVIVRQPSEGICAYKVSFKMAVTHSAKNISASVTPFPSDRGGTRKNEGRGIDRRPLNTFIFGKSPVFDAENGRFSKKKCFLNLTACLK
jgi:hypothetical protein